MSERKMSKYSLPVNGICKFTNEIFPFWGCVFHGCGKCNKNKDSNGKLKKLNCLEKIFKSCKIHRRNN